MDNAATPKENTMKTLTQKIAAAIRSTYPRARRTRPVGIVRNGSSVREVECIVCGDSESCCNRYPETKRVKDFRTQHDADCGAALLNA